MCRFNFTFQYWRRSFPFLQSSCKRMTYEKVVTWRSWNYIIKKVYVFAVRVKTRSPLTTFVSLVKTIAEMRVQS